MTEHRCGVLLVWLAAFISFAMPLYGQSVLTRVASGTGFIVTPDGYILTNKHVIEGATKVTVAIEGREYEAEVVASLPDNDIALLKIDAHGLPTVTLGDSDTVDIGDTVYAIGCPVGVCGTVTMGRVANLGVASKTREGVLRGLIMLDLTITHGSSGGPLLNERGEVIGITTAGVVAQEEPTGFGLAIPINQAIPLLSNIPGFSTSQMGRATAMLSFDEIRQNIGPATAYVEAEVKRLLTDLLPRKVLGKSLQWGWRITDTSSRLFSYLKHNGIILNSISEAYKEVRTGDTTEVIAIAIFDCENEADAQRALSFLATPNKWVLSPTSYPMWGSSELPKWHRDWKGYKVLLSTSKQIAGLTINIVIYYDTCWFLYEGFEFMGEEIGAKGRHYEEPCPATLSRSCHSLVPYVDLDCFAIFTIEDLAFLIVYENQVVGPEYPCTQEKQFPRIVGGGFYTTQVPITYEWVRTGHSFILNAEGETLLSVDYMPFLDNFEEIINTVLRTLAGQ